MPFIKKLKANFSKASRLSKVHQLSVAVALLIALIYPVYALIANITNNQAQALTTQDFTYTGSVQTFTVPQTGAYKLETWGAQGTDAAGQNYGATGGYSTGEVALTAGTILYIYAGGTTDGFNGSCDSGTAAGGGASDVRIGQDDLYARVIVAGGGGGSYQALGHSQSPGGAGGGETGGDGYLSGTGATQILGGDSGDPLAGQFGDPGQFGQGGCDTYPGGGGWYGGGGVDNNNGSGGGGSGWIYTISAYADWTANSQEGQSGQWLLGSDYFLSNATTTADVTSPDSQGMGYVRITQLTSAMSITSVSPDSGSTTGGTDVTITGTGFMPATPTTMQQMTQDYCASMPVYPAAGSTITLTDTRNNQQYDVRKLQDNKCWMIDNLKLELTNGMTLTPADTAVSTNTAVYFTQDGTATGTPLAGMTGNFTTSGYNTRDNTTSSTAPNYDAWRQNDPTNANGSHPEYGYFYNFYTATAGTAPQTQASGTASGSICPANWRLPTGVNASGDFGQLDIAYGGTGVTQVSTPAQLSTLWLSPGAWRGVSSGWYNSGFDRQGLGGYFWASSVYSASSGYLANFISPSVYPGTNSSSRYFGFTVRCVASDAPTPPPTVTFDGVPATNVVVVNDTTVTATTPAHTPGLVSVTVSSSGGGSATLADGYSYVSPPPTVTGITPNHGPTAGGTQVQITGTNLIPTTPATPTTMQQMTPEYCASMGTNSVITLPDSRNGQNYYIGKMPDNKCWMLSNLRYAGEDLTTPYAKYANGGLTGYFGGSQANAYTTKNVYVDPGGSTDYTDWQDTTNTDAGRASKFLGYLYNWCTAMGGQNNACVNSSTTPGDSTHPLDTNTSICPAGWRLPTGNTGGEFQSLYTALGSPYSTFISGFRGVHGGRYDSGLLSQGLFSYYWSSTLYGSLASNAYYLGLTTSSVNSVGAGSRTNGFAVRCVTESGTFIPAVTFDGIPATNVTVVNDTTITATTPAHAAGAVNVEVSNSSGSATLANGYTYRDPPTITSITPNHGPESGGTDVTITGANFNTQYPEFKQISGGNYHTCAITLSDQAYCWGSNESGRLGNGNNVNSSIPVAVSTSGVLADKTIKQISSGNMHTCAIASDDQAYCWGDNSYGRLGNGNNVNSSIPVAVSTGGVLAGKTIKQISSGGSHTCAIASDDQAYCWGYNNDGQLGNGNTGTPSSTPVAVSTSGVLAGKTIKQISVGNMHTCAIASDNQAYCWGANDGYQLGNGSISSRSNVPTAVSVGSIPSNEIVKQISAGQSHTCAIAGNTNDSVADQAYCWGRAYDGRLGNGDTTTSSSTPVAVSTSGVLAGKTIKQVSAGSRGTCAVANDNQTYCWGANDNNQLGNGNPGTPSSTPVAVSTSGVLAGKTIKQISSGGSHTCAIASNSRAYCWGYNASGQLGSGTTLGNYYVPVSVAPFPFTVTFDIAGTPATCNNAVIVNQATITCTTITHTPGLVSVTVGNGVDSVTLPAIYKDASNNNQTCAGSPLPTRCNGQLDSGETRSGDRANLVSGFLYEELYVEASASNLNISITPNLSASSLVSSNSHVVSTKTNNPLGYSLSLFTTSANSRLINTVDSSKYLDGIGTGVANGSLANPIVLSANTWGFALPRTTNGSTVDTSLVSNNFDNTYAPEQSATSSTSKWARVPNSSANALTIKNTSQAHEGADTNPAQPNGDPTTIFYGANISTTMPAGTYKATVTYRVVGRV